MVTLKLHNGEGEAAVGDPVVAIASMPEPADAVAVAEPPQGDKPESQPIPPEKTASNGAAAVEFQRVVDRSRRSQQRIWLQERIGEVVVKLSRLKEEQKGAKKQLDTFGEMLAALDDAEAGGNVAASANAAEAANGQSTAPQAESAAAAPVQSTADDLWGDFDGTTPETLDAANRAAAAATTSEPRLARKPTNPPADWRTVPITELGLVPSLVERFAEHGVSTIGQLEDLRGGPDGLRKVKGVGRAKADAVEDALINWLSRNRDSAVLQQARAGGETVAAPIESTATVQEPTQPVGQSEATATPPAEIPAATESAEPIDPDLGDVLARATALQNGEPNCLAPKMQSHSYHESGKDYYARGLVLTDCPYIAGAEQDDWIRGWLSAKALDEIVGDPDAELADVMRELAEGEAEEAGEAE